MIAAWLAAELESERFGARVREALARLGVESRLVVDPDLTDAGENRIRRAVLDACRYCYSGDWFYELAWWRAALTPEEVLGIRHIAWDDWLEITGCTRMPADGAACDRVRGTPGRYVHGGPPLIAVRADRESHLVAVEGHGRLTAMATHPEEIPRPLEILLGEAQAVRSWGCY